MGGGKGSHDDHRPAHARAHGRPSTALDPILCLATGAGVGYAPWAPGTFGSLWGLPATWVFLMLPGWPYQAFAAMVAIGAGVWIAGRAADRLGVKDPGAVVIDEYLSLPLVFWGLPTGLEKPSVWMLGFVCFRVCDILKPPPARQLERLPRGWGVMADDLMAATYAHLLLQAIVRGPLFDLLR